MTAFHVHHVDHHLAPVLAGAEATLRIMAGWLEGDNDAVYAAINERRRRSPIRAHNLIRRAASLYPVLALRALNYLGRSGQNSVIDITHHLGPLMAKFLASGTYHQARKVLSLAEPIVPECQAQALEAELDMLEFGFRPLLTSHGSYVFYDLLRGKLLHCKPDAGELPGFGLVPAGLTRIETEMLLAVLMQGRLMACTCENGSWQLVSLRSMQGRTLVRGTEGKSGTWLLRTESLFLCAKPDGTMCCDRTEAAAWEMFYLPPELGL